MTYLEPTGVDSRKIYHFLLKAHILLKPKTELEILIPRSFTIAFKLAACVRTNHHFNWEKY